jgi:hypothetical protein
MKYVISFSKDGYSGFTLRVDIWKDVLRLIQSNSKTPYLKCTVYGPGDEEYVCTRGKVSQDFVMWKLSKTGKRELVNLYPDTVEADSGPVRVKVA